MEHSQQKIGADGRVFGEEGEESEDTSRDACRTEKNQVDAPQSGSPPDAVDGGGGRKHK